ncbi:MAG: RHS repeat protein [Parachlamydiales bacterium]|nr:RHS repeat protein [Candidatus Acheromyda pituitae]
MSAKAMIFILLLIHARLGFSDNKQLANDPFTTIMEQQRKFSIDPPYLMGGLVCPLTGQFVLNQTDLIAIGAQNIDLNRVYMPFYLSGAIQCMKQENYRQKNLFDQLQKKYKGWLLFPHLTLEMNVELNMVKLFEPDGTMLEFRLSGGDNSSLISSSSPCTNLAGERVSGQNDLRNTRIVYEAAKNQIIVYAAEGSIRIYNRSALVAKNFHLYSLHKEILSNGKILRYHVNKDGQLICVESLDPQERHIYSSLHISGKPSDGTCCVTSGSGLTVNYHYQRRPINWKIKTDNEKNRKNKHVITEEVKALSPPILTSVSSPFYRAERIEYSNDFLLSTASQKKYEFFVEHAVFGSENSDFRIQKLLFPVGLNDELVPVYEFSYDPPIVGKKGGSTIVKDVDGTSIIYHFCKDLLLASIQYFDQTNCLRKEKRFSWDEKKWLKSIEVHDGGHKLLYKKSYDYDRFGNPILETLEGDLTGSGALETFSIRRSFSDDGRNLLLNEESEDGKEIIFSYLPNTNLVTSKLLKERSRIILREFLVYDDCNNLIQTISDNGSSADQNDLTCVTQRKVKTYILRQSTPFLHMPEWIEESYMEEGVKRLLNKTHLIYDQHGNVKVEEVYDAKGNYLYSIEKTFSESGAVLTETNWRGQRATYTYDQKGFLESSTNFSNRVQRTFRYDANHRLKELTEIAENGEVHTFSADYDFHDRIIQKKNPFDNLVYYHYDPLVSQVARTEFPSIANLDGTSCPVFDFSVYDAFGRKLAQSDLNGHVTSYCYNAYGLPTKIMHPNGGIESFKYDKSGKLISYTDSDQLTVLFKNDVLGRVLSKTYISSNNEVLAEEAFTYNGYNLLTETDREGNINTKVYDGAGRKIRTDYCGRIMDFGYDSRGFVSWICKHNGKNTLFIDIKRDLDGTVLEERRTDISGHLLYQINYSYDDDGNQETVTRIINEQKFVDTYKFDPFGRLEQQQDAQGKITKVTYNMNYTNQLGQKVLQKAIHDPCQGTVVETMDALNRTVQTERSNFNGKTVFRKQFAYDPQGNLLHWQEDVYEDGHFRNPYIVKCCYTENHQIKSLTQINAGQEKTTSYSYFPSLKTATKSLSDGVTLAYSYNPLGLISCLESSDNKIKYSFTYDRLGNLLTAIDANSGMKIVREFDPFGNVLREIFPNSLEINRSYDAFNRLTSIKIAKQGEVRYIYDPLFLKQVRRVSDQGETLYFHSYNQLHAGGDSRLQYPIDIEQDVPPFDREFHQKTHYTASYFGKDFICDSLGDLDILTMKGAEQRYPNDPYFYLSSRRLPKQLLVCQSDAALYKTRNSKNHFPLGRFKEIPSLESQDDQLVKDLDYPESNLSERGVGVTYDPLNRLVEIHSEKQKIIFNYDPLGRLVSKEVYHPIWYGWIESDYEYYLWDLDKIAAHPQ